MSAIDYQNAFSNKQTFTTGTTNYSTNVLDLSGGKNRTAWETFLRSDPGTRNQFPGDTGKLWLNVLIPENMSALTTASASFFLEESADDNTYTQVPGFSASGFTISNMTAGSMPLRQPIAGVTKRYLRMRYAMETAAATTCKVSAWIGEPHDQVKKKS